MTLMAETVRLLMAELNQEVVVNSECTLGLTQRQFYSHAGDFTNALLANPSIMGRAGISVTDVARFVRRTLDGLGKLADITEVGTIIAILSNPRLLHLVKEERDAGGLK